MEYGFNLKFEDLDDELQDRLITEVITYDYENGNISELDEEEKFSLERAIGDYNIRLHTRIKINSHFPIYF